MNLFSTIQCKWMGIWFVLVANKLFVTWLCRWILNTGDHFTKGREDGDIPFHLTAVVPIPIFTLLLWTRLVAHCGPLSSICSFYRRSRKLNKFHHSLACSLENSCHLKLCNGVESFLVIFQPRHKFSWGVVISHIDAVLQGEGPLFFH